MGKVVLQCPYGQIGVITANSVGATPITAKIQDACQVNDENKACSDQFDQAKIKTQFDASCHGKTSCSFDYSASSATNFFVANADMTCFKQSTQIFMQYTCEMTDGQKFDTFEKLTVCTFTTMVIAIVYILVIYYAQNSSQIDSIEYDMNTVTASDYSVEMDISASMWESFLVNNYDAVKKDKDDEGNFKWTRALYCKEYLSEKIKEVLSQYQKEKMALGEGHGQKEIDKLDVFDIQFAYNNHEVINILKKRGAAITYLKWDVVQQCDKDLLAMISDYKQEDGNETGLYVELSRPVCAFITFDSDDGKMAALEYSTPGGWFADNANKVQ